MFSLFIYWSPIFEALEKPEKKKSRMENDNSSRFGLEEKIQLPILQQKNMELE